MTQNSHTSIYEDPQFNVALFAREPGDPPPNGGDPEPPDEGDPPPNGGSGDPPPNGG
jgi:hypothetical protein